MSWHFSQEVEEESSAASYAVTLVSELLKLKVSREKISSKDSEMESCRNSRFGMMSARLEQITRNVPSILKGSEASLETLLLAEGFPARIFPRLGKEQALRGAGRVSGVRWRVSSARYDPDSRSWKTHHCLSSEDLPWSSVILPTWGMMRGGVCWELRRQVLLTKEKGFGYSLPTPTTCPEAPNKNANTKGPKNLLEVAEVGWRHGENWPTPRSRDWKDSGKPEKLAGLIERGNEPTLGRVVAQKGLMKRQTWPTPDKNSGARGTQPNWKARRKSGHSAQYTLNQAVRDGEKVLWRTPTAIQPHVSVKRLTVRKGKLGDPQRHYDKETGRVAQIGLQQQVEMRENFPTPASSDVYTGKLRCNTDGRVRDWRKRATLAQRIEQGERWPTPTKSDSRGKNSPKGLIRRDGKSRMDRLSNVVAYSRQKLPTPRVFMAYGAAHKKESDFLNLEDVVYQETGSAALNPDWVELIMGWPFGWTSLQELKQEEFIAWFKGFSSDQVEEEGSGIRVGNLTGSRFSRGRRSVSCASCRRRFLEKNKFQYGKVAWLSGKWESFVPRTSFVKHRAKRLMAIGNGQVPAVVEMAYRILSGGFVLKGVECE